MNVGAIQTDVQNHGFSDISLADFLTHLNDAYQDLNNLEAWPYLEKTLVTTFSAAAGQFAGTTDIKQVLSLINTAKGYNLTPIRADNFFKDYSNVLTQTGDPVLYYTPNVNATVPNGLALSVWPIPTAVACQLRYLYIPSAFTTVNDLPVLPERFHRVLTWGTLLSLYQMEDDTPSSGRFQGLYDRHIARMREDLWTSNFDIDDVIADVSSDYDSVYYTQ